MALRDVLVLHGMVELDELLVAELLRGAVDEVGDR